MKATGDLDHNELQKSILMGDNYGIWKTVSWNVERVEDKINEWNENKKENYTYCWAIKQRKRRIC